MSKSEDRFQNSKNKVSVQKKCMLNFMKGFRCRFYSRLTYVRKF